MKLNSGLTAIFIVFTWTAWSQMTGNLGQSNNLDLNTRTGFMIFKEEKTLKTIEGSMYLDENFMPCQLSCYEGEPQLMRYNAYKDEIEYNYKDVLYFLKRNDSCVISLNSKKLKLFDYIENGNSSHGYLEILSNDTKMNYGLFKKNSVKLVEAKPAENTYREDIPAHFSVEKSKYFIRIKDEIVELPQKKKEISLLIPEKESAIVTYFKENKNALKTEDDFISLIQFLNGL